MSLYPRPRRYPYRPIQRGPRWQQVIYSPPTVVMLDLTTGERHVYPPMGFTLGSCSDVVWTA